MKMQRKWAVVLLSTMLILPTGASGTRGVVAASASPPPILLEGTIVTMNSAREVIHNGHVLVRDGRIAAMWKGAKPPAGVDLTGAVRVPLGPQAFIYPGLINLHDHPFYGVLPLWQPPSSHRHPGLGRPLGTEPYANRYQWNSEGQTQPEEAARLISNPSTILTAGSALDRLIDVIKYNKARMILGGTTTTQGTGSHPAYDSLLARNVESVTFGRQRIFSRVRSIGSLTSPPEEEEVLSVLSDGLSAGLVDAWLVHLAEGVRDADRRDGDTSSSRAEFAELKANNLLTDATVIVHGIGLEPEDFDEMAHAPAACADCIGDGRGAKLVWSPLSNLLLYGKTAAVYDALAAGVLVSLGTDWTPSGSPNLLTELKVADRTLRDALLLGDRRHIVPDLDRGQCGRRWRRGRARARPAARRDGDDQPRDDGSLGRSGWLDRGREGRRSSRDRCSAQVGGHRGHSTVALSTIDRCHRAGCRARDGRRHRAGRRRRCHVGTQTGRLRGDQQPDRLFRQGD